jgi:hypothetical protein
VKLAIGTGSGGGSRGPDSAADTTGALACGETGGRFGTAGGITLSAFDTVARSVGPAFVLPAVGATGAFAVTGALSVFAPCWPAFAAAELPDVFFTVAPALPRVLAGAALAPTAAFLPAASLPAGFAVARPDLPALPTLVTWPALLEPGVVCRFFATAMTCSR